MHYLGENPSTRGPDVSFDVMSYDESFLAPSGQPVRLADFHCLEMPEAELSFHLTVALMLVLQRITDGDQVQCATHSPVLASLPGATFLEVSDAGILPTAWEDLGLVRHGRSFLYGPGRSSASCRLAGLDRASHGVW